MVILTYEIAKLVVSQGRKAAGLILCKIAGLPLYNIMINRMRKEA
jgi:hypothetical protein